MYKKIRIPKRIELGEILEKQECILKGKLTEPLDVVKLKIKNLDEELGLMWFQKFDYIERKINQLMGKESLLFKNKGIDEIWRKFEKEEDDIQNKIDNFRNKIFNDLENRVYELKRKQNLLFEKHGILKKWNEIDKEKGDIESKIQLLNFELKAFVGQSDRLS